MYNQKVHSIFQNLEAQFCNIYAEINSFMGNIIEWADELVEIIEKEFTAEKNSALFLLPKTPSEKKTRHRKARNALVSKCSNINSTFSHNETNTLDETISSRTRGGRRAANSKKPQLDSTREVQERHSEYIWQENAKIDQSNATFVMPKSSTRTKPVLRSKLHETAIPEPTPVESLKDQLVVSNAKESPPKKISRTSGIVPESSSRSKTSRSPSRKEEQDESPIIVGETPTERLSRRKISRTLSKSPAERQSSRKVLRSLSGSPVARCSDVLISSSNNTPVLRSSSLRSSKNTSKTLARGSSRNNSGGDNFSMRETLKVFTPEKFTFSGDKTVTIKNESTPTGASTFVVVNATYNASVNDEEKTPTVKEERFFRLSKTSTPATNIEKTPSGNARHTKKNFSVNSGTENVAEGIANASASDIADNATEEPSRNSEIPKKKRKLKKDEELKENIREMSDTVRITRTKSKAIKQMMEENETKQADFQSAFAKKLLNRAKMNSMKKSQLAALLECNSSTPTNGPVLGNGLPFGNLTTSKSKYHLLLSSSKKLKTPLATLPNSVMKITSGDKDRLKTKVATRDSSVENAVRSGVKPPKNGQIEREIKLKSKKDKEEEAAVKRQNVIKSKQEELKRKNELKHHMAMKQREKLEQEKYYNMIQSEKEKEERHKIILQERQLKLKEEALKKKLLTQQKIAETVERRRMEEEARIAKLKEMEAEEQRLALEKQKEQERQEKRAQERLAQKKAREEYEMQLKQELEAERLKAEKLLTTKKCLASASKMQTASKRQKLVLPCEKREWDYKPRNENDYGLDDEHSEVDSEDEKSYDKTKPPMPWAKKILQGKSPVVKILTLEMLCEFMPCYRKSPDIHKMFKMTPSKRIKRTSSAIWSTPNS